MAVVAVVTLIGILAAPLLIWVFAPGLATQEEGRQDLAAQMLRITFPYLLFISLTAMAAGILNSIGRFAVPAFTPVFLNLALIVAALWLAPMFAEPIVALAWGVFIAGACSSPSRSRSCCARGCCRGRGFAGHTRGCGASSS